MQRDNIIINLNKQSNMEIKLKKNGWHHRLQVYVLGRLTPEFMNFCPYFWITNFCILVTFIIPIVPLVKAISWIVRGISSLFEAATDWFDRAICEPLMKSSALGMDDESLIKAWSIHSYLNFTPRTDDDWADYSFWTGKYFKKSPSSYKFKVRDDMDKKFELWKVNTPNWEQRLAKIKDQRKKDWEVNQLEQEKTRNRLAEQEVKNREKTERAKVFKQKAFTAIIKYTKWLSIVIGLALLSWVGYWVYVFINWAWDHFNYAKFLTILKYVGSAIVVTVILFGIIFLFIKLFKSIACRCLGACKLFDNAFCRFLGKHILASLIWVGRGLVVIGVAIGGFFKFFIDYIMAVKQDYCPGIVWEEDNF